MKRACTDEENLLLTSYLRGKFDITGLDGCKFEVNGATLYGRRFTGFNNYEIWYFEDDFVDENGNYYIITIPDNRLFSNVNAGARLIVLSVIGDNFSKELMVIPVDGTTWQLIGAKSSFDYRNISLEQSKKIPDKKALYLENGVKNVNPYIFNKIKNLPSLKKETGFHVIIRIFLAIIMAIILVGLAYIFTVAGIGYQSDSIFIGISLAYLFALIGCSVGFSFLLGRLSNRKISNCLYCQNMLLTGVYKQTEIAKDCLMACGYIFQDGIYRPVSFPIDRCSIRFSKDFIMDGPQLVNVYMNNVNIDYLGYHVISNL